MQQRPILSIDKDGVRLINADGVNIAAGAAQVQVEVGEPGQAIVHLVFSARFQAPMVALTPPAEPPAPDGAPHKPQPLWG